MKKYKLNEIKKILSKKNFFIYSFAKLVKHRYVFELLERSGKNVSLEHYSTSEEPEEIKEFMTDMMNARSFLNKKKIEEEGFLAMISDNYNEQKSVFCNLKCFSIIRPEFSFKLIEDMEDTFKNHLNILRFPNSKMFYAFPKFNPNKRDIKKILKYIKSRYPSEWKEKNFEKIAERTLKNKRKTKTLFIDALLMSVKMPSFDTSFFEEMWIYDQVGKTEWELFKNVKEL